MASTGQTCIQRLQPVQASGSTNVAFLRTRAVKRPSVPRSIDIVVLWLAGALQLVVLVVWALIPRLPRWVIAGWGLILAATGIGLIIAAPVPAGATAMPWALVGLLVAGIATILLSAIHGESTSSLLA